MKYHVHIFALLLSCASNTSEPTKDSPKDAPSKTVKADSIPLDASTPKLLKTTKSALYSADGGNAPGGQRLPSILDPLRTSSLDKTAGHNRSPVSPDNDLGDSLNKAITNAQANSRPDLKPSITTAIEVLTSNVSLTKEDVLTRIQHKYLDGLKRCHAIVRNDDLEAHGTVTSTLKIAKTGRVTNSKTTGFHADVVSCIQGQTLRWRFRAPRIGEKAATAELKITLTLGMQER